MFVCEVEGSGDRLRMEDATEPGVNVIEKGERMEVKARFALVRDASLCLLNFSRSCDGDAGVGGSGGGHQT